MRTDAQIEAARRNGAKSKGPVTAEGKAASSKNAMKHGLSSEKAPLLDGESSEEFNELLAAYMEKFQPRDSVESDLATEMAVARWRLRRAWSLETAAIDKEIPDQTKRAKRLYKRADTEIVHAMAFSAAATDLKNIDRYETRLRRIYDRALRNLLDLRKLPNKPEPTEKKVGQAVSPAKEIQPNEPDDQPLQGPVDQHREWIQRPGSGVDAEMQMRRRSPGIPGIPDIPEDTALRD
jgi:hypothetical protein